MDNIWAALAGYVLGSIPFGLILTRMAGMGDVRNIGSGNIGATNVLRTGNKGLAAATLLLDMFKGYLAVFLAWQFFPEAAGFAAVGAIIGHCFPLWLKFKGGKGVATLAGVCFGLAWPIGAFYALAWLGMLAIWRISSLAGMTAAVAAPVAAYLTGRGEFVPFLAAIAILILWLHRANIGRLKAGTEPKVGSKK
ncbi:glycerol-3-phosphate 1-O-acyltransferase PlsY [Allopontixanthobacter sp.]|uniref:glycerol-3-phosphate 1-O-acyltransferase PlsY n=1 Tax=Allopontixanthobacter sp. TaxID=2906452 RepID=UPI002ABCDDD4|nr:glycerol-3-phosphate 1-O-acyltransferase PlsY [Allopontixanthobacter sp.]MDZ4307237.1 glycerol-3-phosphate 1-O-acyltransferase PlsY [Allopontixanthobacter sp.]